jgi:hypothetical protein
MLTTTDEILTYLKLSADTADGRYDLIRRGCEAAVKTFCKWPIEREVNHVEYLSGNGYRDLPLPHPFVSVVSDLRLDMTAYYGDGVNAFAANTALTPGSDFSLVREGPIGKSGLLRRILNNVFWWPSDIVFNRASGGLSYRKPSAWPVGYGNIKATYTYGFVQNLPVSAATLSGNTATITSTAHGLWVGAPVRLRYFTPSAWNVSAIVRSVTANTFTIDLFGSPGAVTVLGYADAIPEDIKLAVATSVGLIRNTLLYGGWLSSENLADYSYSLTRLEGWGGVRELLAPYRDFPIGAIV